jgi:protein-S-isoprenylcysteine O-methyltransferase Ste14
MGWASRYLLLGFVPLPNLLASHFCAISLLLLALFAWADLMIGHPAIMVNAAPMKAAGAVLVILGLALHFWAFSTLRNWWTDDKLCTMGSFKFFRHPIYAAWITFISSGVALYFNSWVYFFWVLLLHPIWHKLVRKEETRIL